MCIYMYIATLGMHVSERERVVFVPDTLCGKYQKWVSSVFKSRVSMGAQFFLLFVGDFWLL